MDDVTISEIDEATVRAISVRCALLEVELYIQGGGTIAVNYSQDTTRTAIGG